MQSPPPGNIGLFWLPGYPSLPKSSSHTFWSVSLDPLKTEPQSSRSSRTVFWKTRARGFFSPLTRVTKKQQNNLGDETNIVVVKHLRMMLDLITPLTSPHFSLARHGCSSEGTWVVRTSKRPNLSECNVRIGEAPWSDKWAPIKLPINWYNATYAT